jgi:hypothetical protein
MRKRGRTNSELDRVKANGIPRTSECVGWKGFGGRMAVGSPTGKKSNPPRTGAALDGNRMASSCECDYPKYTEETAGVKLASVTSHRSLDATALIQTTPVPLQESIRAKITIIGSSIRAWHREAGLDLKKDWAVI